MAVLIEGIEMPKHDDEYVIFTVYGDGGVVYGPLNRPHVRYKHRAVPVPELHGRLGDLDALPLYLANTSVKYATYEDWEMLCDAIAAAPTVIPASEEGET